MRILSVYWSFGDFFSGLQTLTAIVLGAVFCVRGVITEGDFIAFSTYNSMLVWPVRSLGRVISEMAKVGVSVDRIRAVMNASEEPMDAPDRNAQALSGKTADPFAGDICFEHVHFRYGSGSDTEVLRDVSFRVKAGTTTGILGGTGSGKSTIAWLLDRLYDLPEGCGRITIGGVDIASMSRREVRAHVGLVLQEPFLFSRTLYDNIRIAENGAEAVTPESGEGIPEDRKRGSGRPAASDPVRAAASDACLDKTIASFPDGYDTVVGERGVTLSGGQKQRTAIAQTLIRHTPVLVFDDSLSAVDAETDAEIRRALRERTRNATVLLIAHRITTLMQADQIIVLEHGRIAQQGTHEELIRQPFFMTEKEDNYRHSLDQHLASKGMELMPFLEVSDTGFILQMVQENLGFSFLPRYVVESSVYRSKLKIVNVKNFRMSMYRQLFYHKNKWLTSGMKAFLSAVEKGLV